MNSVSFFKSLLRYLLRYPMGYTLGKAPATENKVSAFVEFILAHIGRQKFKNNYM